jgi:carbamoyl-phosphate synthase large subunit
MPRFAFEKFPNAEERLTTQMKSVGEVMAMGSTFQESLQKAIRGLETDKSGLNPIVDTSLDEAKSKIRSELISTGADRIYYIADAFRLGMSQSEIYDFTKIDRWFLSQIEDLVLSEKTIQGTLITGVSAESMFQLKRKGFSDKRLSELMECTEEMVRQRREKLNIKPVFKRVDSCAAEFDTQTAYLYSTYQHECEANPSSSKKIMILGGGPNRIGQGIEFDYCCVHASQALRRSGYETIMVNCNPETVSTDYDISDRLYFEPLTLEDVLAVIEVEKPEGIIVHYGGQTPLKLAAALEKNGAKIIGTSPDAIDLAEDRERFQKMIQKLNLKQPVNATARSQQEAVAIADSIGFPLVVRPSYVLGGRAMEIVYNKENLERYMQTAVQVSNDSPVLLDSFLDHAIEIDIDVICDGRDVVIGGIMEHIEQAGIHSGDSACSLPPHSLPNSVLDEMRKQVKLMAKELNVVGLMNTQLAYQDKEIYVIEVNPRASRTIPFVSKATGVALANIAARVMVGVSLKEQSFTQEVIPKYYSVKESVFPFNKFLGVDPILGPEMRSTGEVMGIGDSFPAAFDKALLAAGEKIPTSGKVFVSLRTLDRKHLTELGRRLTSQGFEMVATRTNQEMLQEIGLECTMVNKVSEGSPHIVDLIKNDEISLIINSTEDTQGLEDATAIRCEALIHKVPCTTTVAAAFAMLDGINTNNKLVVRSIQSLH